MERVEGTVQGLDKYDDVYIVLYSLGGSTWYVQPFVGSAMTAISAAGQWRSRIHLGSEYAALLVRAGYEPKSQVSLLPAVRGDVLAAEVVDAK